MAVMLSRLGGRGYCIAEDSVPDGTKPEKVDPGPDFDFDSAKEKRMYIVCSYWLIRL
jgi:hypothetical protein